MTDVVKAVPQSFGRTPDGVPVDLYELINPSGMRVAICTYGARIIRWMVPDRAGRFENVILGYDALNPYLETRSYFGCVVGRYANRISRGRFVLEGKTIQLSKNEGEN